MHTHVCNVEVYINALYHIDFPCGFHAWMTLESYQVQNKAYMCVLLITLWAPVGRLRSNGRIIELHGAWPNMNTSQRSIGM